MTNDNAETPEARIARLMQSLELTDFGCLQEDLPMLLPRLVIFARFARSFADALAASSKAAMQGVPFDGWRDDKGRSLDDLLATFHVAAGMAHDALTTAEARFKQHVERSGETVDEAFDAVRRAVRIEEQKARAGRKFDA